MIIGSLFLIRKGAFMRSPHHDASAASGWCGPRRSRLMVPALLVLVSGCVVQQTPRLIEGEVALAQIKQKAARPPAAPAIGPARADGRGQGTGSVDNLPGGYSAPPAPPPGPEALPAPPPPATNA
jgi:hypothetical protein